VQEKQYEDNSEPDFGHPSLCAILLEHMKRSSNARVATELDLSPHVQSFWEEKGYCVHGEVALSGKAVFIDHVAHLGPCDAPEYIVAIEMKRGASKSLQSQLMTLDTTHVADELWGITVSTPRTSTLQRWDDTLWPWMLPGLCSWNGDHLDVHRWATCSTRANHKRYYRRRDGDLLLIPENRGIHAGYPSGDHQYITHWSAGQEYLLRWAASQGRFTTQDCFDEGLPSFLFAYKKVRQAMTRILRQLHVDGRLIRRGKVGSFVEYEYCDD
jgi:hypothetical protein